MNHQGKRLFFLIQLFSDIQAKKFVVKKWRSFLQTIFLPTKFYANFFSSDKVCYIPETYIQDFCYQYVFEWKIFEAWRLVFVKVSNISVPMTAIHSGLYSIK